MFWNELTKVDYSQQLDSESKYRALENISKQEKINYYIKLHAFILMKNS